MGILAKRGLNVKINEFNSSDSTYDRKARVYINNDDYTPFLARKNIRKFIDNMINHILLPIGTPTLIAYIDDTKEKDLAIFIIGHITKEGSIAGPRILEHMVDTVLYFEGDSSQELRILRGFKNRFGATSEIGVFEMKNEGLVSATDIASRFFNRNSQQSGSALTVIMEGSRPIILEVQALVSESHTPNSKRQATGFDNTFFSA